MEPCAGISNKTRLRREPKSDWPFTEEEELLASQFPSLLRFVYSFFKDGLTNYFGYTTSYITIVSQALKTGKVKVKRERRRKRKINLPLVVLLYYSSSTPRKSDSYGRVCDRSSSLRRERTWTNELSFNSSSFLIRTWLIDPAEKKKFHNGLERERCFSHSEFFVRAFTSVYTISMTRSYTRLDAEVLLLWGLKRETRIDPPTLCSSRGRTSDNLFLSDCFFSLLSFLFKVWSAMTVHYFNVRNAHSGS